MKRYKRQELRRIYRELRMLRHEDGQAMWRPESLDPPELGQLVCAICGQRHPSGIGHTSSEATK